MLDDLKDLDDLAAWQTVAVDQATKQRRMGNTTSNRVIDGRPDRRRARMLAIDQTQDLHNATGWRSTKK